MKITLAKLADEKRLAVVPFNKDQSDSLRDEERNILRSFGHIELDVASLKAFPLNVLQLRGSTRNLAIYPRSGGTINLGRSQRLEIKNERGDEVHIHSEPFKDE